MAESARILAELIRSCSGQAAASSVRTLGSDRIGGKNGSEHLPGRRICPAGDSLAASFGEWIAHDVWERRATGARWRPIIDSLREPPVEKSLPNLPVIESLPLPLERDIFLRTLLRELSGTLQDVVGLEEASGFVSVVGQRIGDQINNQYKTALDVPQLTAQQVSEVLVDLKRRIQGDFFVIEQDDQTIVLGNRACPFGDKVVGRPALCMMTSNVFGVIAAENLGYAKVVLENAIARGDAGCRVVVYLKPTEEAEAASGREYFQG